MVYEYVAEKFNEGTLEEELKDPRVIYFLMKQKSNFIGYAKLIMESPPKFVQEKNLVHMERLYFDKRFQGRGAGTVLLKHCEEFVRNKGYLGLWLGVWDENQEAISFYKAKGYEKVGAHNWEFSYKGCHYIDTDDVMVKLGEKKPNV